MTEGYETIIISKHNYKHLKYLARKYDLRKYDDVIDWLLLKTKHNWDCMDDPDFEEKVKD